MDNRIGYRTYPTDFASNEDVDYVFNFDAAELACPASGRLYPRFFLTVRQPGASIPSLRVWLQDPRDGFAHRQILLYSAVDVPLDPNEVESSVIIDCCCKGRPVPFALGEGPLPRYQLHVAATSPDTDDGMTIILEVWWLMNYAPASIGPAQVIGGAFGT